MRLLPLLLAATALRTFHIPPSADVNLALAPALHAHVRGEDVLVRLAAGRHVLSEPLIFGEFDNGEGGSTRGSITISGPTADDALSGPAILDGGVEIKDWSLCADSSWLWCASVPENVSSVDQLWVGGARRFPARSATMAYNNTLPHDKDGKSSTVVCNSGQLLPSYAALPALRVVLYHSWTASLHSVAQIDQSMATIHLAQMANCRWDTGSASGNRFYLENAPEYLAKGSGGFFFDGKQLQYAALASEVVSGTFNIPVFAARLVELMAGSNTSGVSVSNVVLEHAAVDWTNCLTGTCDGQSADFLTSAALHWEMSSNISLHNITLRKTGGYGVWFGPGVVDASLTHSTITDVGAGAVRVGEGKGGMETPARLATDIKIEDNFLMNGGWVYQEGCGVLVQSAARTSVAHNEIHHFRYTGVSVGWTWNYIPTTETNNTVAFNRIHDIGLRQLSDMACVYHLGRDPGTQILNNICYNVTSYDYGGWGYYTDQASTAVVIRDNIAYDTKCGGFHQHYGMDNTLSNNIFADVNSEGCDSGIRSSAHDAAGDEGDDSSFSFFNNILYWANGPAFMATTKNGFANVTFDKNVYWNHAGAKVTFPCPADDPYEHRSFLSTNEHLAIGQHITADTHSASARMDTDGRLCVYDNADPAAGKRLYCTPNAPVPDCPGCQIAMQGDGNLCIYTSNHTVLWCDMVHPGASNYYLQIHANTSLCVHHGQDPDHDGGQIWCASASSTRTQPPTRVDKRPLQFPTDCDLASWQAQGRGLNSIVADPLFNAPSKHDYSLDPSSPALNLGFQPIDTSQVGPR